MIIKNKIYEKEGGIIHIKVKNNLLIAYSNEKCLTVYVIDEDYRQLIKLHTNEFIKMKFLKNYLITFNKQIVIYDLSDNLSLKCTISYNKCKINSIKDYNNYIISASEDKKIKIYNMDKNFLLENEIDLDYIVKRLKIIDNYLMACSNIGINIYKIQENLSLYPINSFNIPSIKLRSCDNYIMALSYNLVNIYIFKFENENFKLINKIQDKDELVFFLTKNNYLILSTKYETKLYNVTNLFLEKKICHDKMTTNYAVLTNRLFITCSEENGIILYDKESDFKIIKILKDHTSSVNSLCIYNNLLLTCSDDHYILIYDLDNLYFETTDKSLDKINTKKITSLKDLDNKLGEKKEYSKYEMDQFKIYYNKKISILENMNKQLKENIRYIKDNILVELNNKVKNLEIKVESNEIKLKENQILSKINKEENKKNINNWDIEFKNSKLNIYYNDNTKFSLIKK